MPINLLMATGAITKNGTLSMTFHRLLGEENPYFRFGYGLMTIFYHTQGQVSGSINSDTMNIIHTRQQSTKDLLNN